MSQGSHRRPNGNQMTHSLVSVFASRILSLWRDLRQWRGLGSMISRKVDILLFWLSIDREYISLIEDIDGVYNTLKGLFRYQERLYASGARNFLLFDLPPIHRSPSGIVTSSTVVYMFILKHSTRRCRYRNGTVSDVERDIRERTPELD